MPQKGFGHVATRVRTFVVLAIALPCAAVAQSEYQNLTLEQAFEALERDGLLILYSSDLVKPWMRVRDEPASDTPREILVEILIPHDILVEDGPDDTLLLVRNQAVAEAPDVEATPIAAAVIAPQEPDLAEIIVSTSQYNFVRGSPATVTSFSAADLQITPDFSDDPLRTLAVLPGAARGDFSAKVNVRGGGSDETLVRFDDLRLYNPFHLKDFQAFFSAIDPQIASDINVYTGAFPVSFGDRMSSVIEIEPLQAEEKLIREISLSFFNASLMSAGRFNDDKTDWLVSGRRGNMDLILEFVETKVGEPSYVDLYGRIRHAFTDSISVSANFLLFDDNVLLFMDDDEERATADYRDEYYWLRIDLVPSANLAGNILIARTELDGDRSGRVIQPGVAFGSLDEMQTVTIESLQADWSWRVAEPLEIQFGGEIRSSEGRYSYRDDAQFELLFLEPGAPNTPTRTRNLDAIVDGEQYGAYLNLRWEPLTRLTAEAGLRWDKETLSPESDDQLSPRISALYRLGKNTDLRASWGRFFQAQAPNELQISDGETTFFPAERSDQVVASLEHRLSSGIELRIEAYEKAYKQLRPRYENLLNTFVYLPELKPDRVRVAPDRATAKGLEIMLRRPASDPLGWWVNYTWSEVKDTINGVKSRRNWDQQHGVNAGVNYRTEKWELSVAGKYHSGWPTTSANLASGGPVPLVATGPRNDRRLSNYRSVDARVARLYQFSEANTLTVFVEVSNVFDHTNDCCVQFEIEPSTAMLNLETEKEPYLPRFPSAGFIWRF